MLENCTLQAMGIMERFKHFVNSATGIFLSTAITGMLGIIILLAFFSMLFSPSVLLMILPGIIAFNCAAGGYSLTDKGINSSVATKQAHIGLAVLLTATGCTAIILFCPWEPLMDGSRYLISGLSALLFTFFGSWLAKKSKSLNKET